MYPKLCLLRPNVYNDLPKSTHRSVTRNLSYGFLLMLGLLSAQLQLANFYFVFVKLLFCSKELRTNCPSSSTFYPCFCPRSCRFCLSELLITKMRVVSFSHQSYPYCQLHESLSFHLKTGLIS